MKRNCAVRVEKAVAFISSHFMSRTTTGSYSSPVVVLESSKPRAGLLLH